MKTHIFLFIIIMFSAVDAHAQRISFETTTVDAGTTLWKRPVTAVYKFTNRGRTPLVVRSVDAGCGCMEAQWPTEPVERSETGEIRITYDAQLLGTTDRYIDVYTNASEQPVRLRMKARVSATDPRSFEERYPYSIGDIRLSANDVEFTDVNAGDSAMVEIEIYNSGAEVYEPVLMHLPPYLTAVYKPQMIARGRSGVIELTLHSAKLPDLGLNQTDIYLARFFGDKVSGDNEIAVSAVKLPSPHTERPAHALGGVPDFRVSTTALHVGKLGRKTKLKGVVSLSNKGTGVLKISKIQAFNPAVSVKVGKTELQPGEVVKMNVTIDSHFLGRSKAASRVLIITDDPNHPKEVVDVIFEK